MNHTTRAVRTAALAALALLTAGAVPAQAAPHQERAGNWLYITVTPSATEGGTQTQEATGVLLLCNPPQGHARADRACGELDRAGGDITRIPHADTFCPMVYAPVEASARGEWNGRTVKYDQTFANACAMTVATGSVFDLTP
jgi:hypothetical protein